MELQSFPNEILNKVMGYSHSPNLAITCKDFEVYLKDIKDWSVHGSPWTIHSFDKNLRVSRDGKSRITNFHSTIHKVIDTFNPQFSEDKEPSIFVILENDTSSILHSPSCWFYENQKEEDSVLDPLLERPFCKKVFSSLIAKRRIIDFNCCDGYKRYSFHGQKVYHIARTNNMMCFFHKDSMTLARLASYVIQNHIPSPLRRSRFTTICKFDPSFSVPRVDECDQIINYSDMVIFRQNTTVWLFFIKYDLSKFVRRFNPNIKVFENIKKIFVNNKGLSFITIWNEQVTVYNKHEENRVVMIPYGYEDTINHPDAYKLLYNKEKNKKRYFVTEEFFEAESFGRQCSYELTQQGAVVYSPRGRRSNVFVEISLKDGKIASVDVPNASQQIKDTSTEKDITVFIKNNQVVVVRQSPHFVYILFHRKLARFIASECGRVIAVNIKGNKLLKFDKDPRFVTEESKRRCIVITDDKLIKGQGNRLYLVPRKKIKVFPRESFLSNYIHGQRIVLLNYDDESLEDKDLEDIALTQLKRLKGDTERVTTHIF